jgi:acetate kinase
MDAILVVNAGSSSVKFQVFETDGKRSLNRLIKGQMDGIGTRPRLRAEAADKKLLVDQTFPLDVVPDVGSAIREAGAWLRASQSANLIAVGHRVVHGGPDYHRPMLIDNKVIDDLERFVPLAPLHQPNNLAPIRSLLKNSPEIPQIACFDTAFHRGHSDVADHFAIPQQFYREGVRRYGFHGLSYEFVSKRLRELSPAAAQSRVIIAHLGSGASMCALLNGQSVESTMGFTALDGLPMGTRSGQIDPGVLLYFLSQKGMDAATIQTLLYNGCGLKGLSGISNDMREVESSKDPGAVLAVDYFVYRVGLYAGMLAAALSGLDTFVFTAGIGENSTSVRARIAEKIAWLGAKLDHEANVGRKSLISRPESRVKLYVIPTDEEVMIAEHALAVVAPAASRKTTSTDVIAHQQVS